MENALTREFEREMGLLLESINLKYNYDFRNYALPSMKRTLVQAMDRMGERSLAAL